MCGTSGSESRSPSAAAQTSRRAYSGCAGSGYMISEASGMHRGERSGQTNGPKTLTFNARSFLAQSFDKLNSAPLPLARQVVRQLIDLAKCDRVRESFWLRTRTQKSHIEVDVLPVWHKDHCVSSANKRDLLTCKVARSSLSDLPVAWPDRSFSPCGTAAS